MASTLLAVAVPSAWLRAAAPTRRAAASPWQQFTYSDVDLHGGLTEQQLDHHLALLMSLDEDSLLKPFRQMSGAPAPGADLGGWYSFDPDHFGIDEAYAPSATFGQWVSALARMYAIKRAPQIRARVMRLNELYAQTISGTYFEVNRFPAYCLDKLLCGLIDAHEFAADPDAFSIMGRAIDAALPHLPARAIEHGQHWRLDRDASYDSDESYTVAENLYLAYQRGAGDRYRRLANTYLDDSYFGPLSAGQNNLAGRHAYSYVNALSSAMQAYLTAGSIKHLQAAAHGFDFLRQQSYVTGGWGPDETLRAPGTSDLYDSLTRTHSSFETPCGAYAHFKLTRYLLRAIGDARFGDSMERMMYNTILGAKPIQADGRTFYYSDYHRQGRKVYSPRRWPCCSGTLPQVAADYRINTYFHNAEGLCVNLYLPSTVRWRRHGTRITLTQTSDYPLDGAIELRLQVERPERFVLQLRIPQWAAGAALTLNGRRVEIGLEPGTFASLTRLWHDGDRVQLELPLRLRLESIDGAHPDTAAVLRGPLVLFALGESPPPLTRGALLSARRVGAQSWEATGPGGPIRFVPFTAIADEPYRTYQQVVS